MPPIAAAMESIVSVSAVEFITHAMATRTPPTKTTILGPNRSTSQPSTGTSQVSVRTKIVNATWMAARPQGYFSPIGQTNSVQPYCRLAIITMQMMPATSCSQRIVGREATAEDSTCDISQTLP